MLGLGELNVRSYLGQPLHATVKIIDANAATHADCFSLRPSADSAVPPPPPRAQLRLERRGDDAVLHIRTATAIDEPIAQFSLTSDCDSRLQRDYVVLLDPPSAATLAYNENVPGVPPLKASLIDGAQSAADTPAPPPRERAPRQSVSMSRSAAASARQADVQPRRPATQAESAARLVLSGRHPLQAGGLALRFDTTLPDLNRPRADNLTPDELSDENTALTRKLAHLESQLQDLNRRNAELEARRARVSTRQPSPAITDSLPHQWPLYLLIVALLIATAGMLVWLLRRRRATHADQAVLLDPAPPAADIDRMTNDPWTTPPQGRKPHTESRTDAKSGPIVEFAPSATAQPTTEVNDDILDQAEVYMAHGHGDLAIHLLQEHLRAAPDESPVPWLLLLDLLHREGDTAGYAAASTECRRHFNIKLSGLETLQDKENGYGIEAYPHILEELLKVWGTPEADAFFADLIFDRRGGTRIGFEPGAYREILLLRAIAETR